MPTVVAEGITLKFNPPLFFFFLVEIIRTKEGWQKVHLLSLTS